MIEIVLVRHAEPEWEPGGRAVDEPSLTERGRAQARATAEALEGEQFDAAYVSPLSRARETAEPVLERLGMETRVEQWLAELRLPPLHGRTTTEVQHFFEQARLRDLEKWWDGMPGGESFRHFYERVRAGVEALLLGSHRLRAHEDSGHRIWRIPEDSQRLLILAHNGTNAILISHLLGIEPVPWAWERFSSCHAGISRLHTAPVASGAVWILESFNRVRHLDAVGATR